MFRLLITALTKRARGIRPYTTATNAYYDRSDETASFYQLRPQYARKGLALPRAGHFGEIARQRCRRSTSVAARARTHSALNISRTSTHNTSKCSTAHVQQHMCTHRCFNFAESSCVSTDETRRLICANSLIPMANALQRETVL